MLELPDPQAAKQWCEQQRQQGRRIGYVATMGALHAGHLSLLDRAVQQNHVTCTSIFVNPLQFNDPEDLARYPNTYESDATQLRQGGCDMLYRGTLRGFFPHVDALDRITCDCPSPAAAGLEGEFRPRHLDGVWTIVERLFDTVGPCTAYFGEKDFQQTLIIKDLAAQLRAQGIQINIVVCPTVRAANGLALSSRNQRLSHQQQQRAAHIYTALGAAKRLWQSGQRDPSVLEQTMLAELAAGELIPEYASVRDPHRWTPDTPQHRLTQAQALIACYLDTVRLLDTLRLDDLS